jgi:copper(I)-binding protein
MPKVLTLESSVLCGPAGPTHGGKVALTSSAKLTVNNQVVLTKTGVGPSVTGCKTVVTNSGNKPCTTVSISSGEATKLTANGNKVMLDTIGGTGDGQPTGTVQGSAIQSKLTAI